MTCELRQHDSRPPQKKYSAVTRKSSAQPCRNPCFIWWIGGSPSKLPNDIKWRGSEQMLILRLLLLAAVLFAALSIIVFCSVFPKPPSIVMPVPSQDRVRVISLRVNAGDTVCLFSPYNAAHKGSAPDGWLKLSISGGGFSSGSLLLSNSTPYMGKYGEKRLAIVTQVRFDSGSDGCKVVAADSTISFELQAIREARYGREVALDVRITD